MNRLVFASFTILLNFYKIEWKLLYQSRLQPPCFKPTISSTFKDEKNLNNHEYVLKPTEKKFSSDSVIVNNSNKSRLGGKFKTESFCRNQLWFETMAKRVKKFWWNHENVRHFTYVAIFFVTSQQWFYKLWLVEVKFSKKRKLPNIHKITTCINFIW